MPKRLGGMGFRDLKVFNMALLAKQVWRLHCGVNPSLGGILKAWYFKHSSVIEAQRGHVLVLHGGVFRVLSLYLLMVWRGGLVMGFPLMCGRINGFL